MEETDRENGADRHPLEGAGREERMVGTLLLQKLYLLYKKLRYLISSIVIVHGLRLSMNLASGRPCINFINYFC